MKTVFSLRKSWAGGAVSVALALCFSTWCLAQSSAPAPSWTHVTVSKVKPDMLQEWTDLQKNEVNPALKKAGVPWRGVWQTAVFGDSYEWAAVTPIEKFAQYDEPSPLVKALGQEGFTRLITKIRKCISGSHSYAFRFRPDLSIQKEMKEPPQIAVVTSVRVTPGREPDFENFLKNDILPVLKKSDIVGYFVHQTVFGGDGTQWVGVTLYNKFADLDAGPPLVRVLGQEGANKLLAKAAGLVTSVERSVTRYNRDLSYFTPPSAR